MDEFFYRVYTFLGIDGMKGMVPILQVRNYYIIIFTDSDQILYYLSVEKRHITGGDEAIRMRRVEKTSIDTD
jgi:hypothetical protein